MDPAIDLGLVNYLQDGAVLHRLFFEILLLQKLHNEFSLRWFVFFFFFHVLSLTQEARGHPQHKQADCSGADCHPLHESTVDGGANVHCTHLFYFQ